jgi:Tol biopolymer transport system component
MRLLTLVGVIAVVVAVVLAGCGGSSSSYLYQNASERASWGPTNGLATSNYLAFTSYGGSGQKYVYRCTELGGGQFLLTKSDASVTASQEGGFNPTFSPGGALIAFASRRKGGSTSIYQMDPVNGDTTSFKALTDTTVAGEDTQPNWSHDGTKLIFTTTKVVGGLGTGTQDIAIQNSDGTGARQYAVATAAVEQWPTFSPDDTQIAYQVGPKDGPTDIVIRTLAGGAETNLTAALRKGAGDLTRFEAPAWGTVGGEQWIYFHTNLNGDFDIYRIRPTGADLTQITSGVFSDGYPVLKPDGTKVLFTRDRELWSRTSAPGTATETRVTRKYY